jgi:hypothetical protein
MCTDGRAGGDDCHYCLCAKATRAYQRLLFRYVPPAPSGGPEPERVLQLQLALGSSAITKADLATGGVRYITGCWALTRSPQLSTKDSALTRVLRACVVAAGDLSRDLHGQVAPYEELLAALREYSTSSLLCPASCERPYIA